MVDDLNTSYRTSSWVGPANLTAVGSRIFFVRQTVGGGTELYVSDGTEAGTRQVKDIAPGTALRIRSISRLSETSCISSPLAGFRRRALEERRNGRRAPCS